MIQRFVDNPEIEAFFDVDEPVQIIGSSGRTLGWIHPKELTADDIEIPELSEEELQRRLASARRGEGYTTEEVLAYLETLE